MEEFLRQAPDEIYEYEKTIEMLKNF